MRLAVATGSLSAIVVGLELVRPSYVISPSGRVALETLIALSAIFTARLLAANFQESGRLPDLMLLCALVAASLTDFVYCAVPALAAGVRPEAGGGARLCCSLIVSVAFAAAAFAPSKVIRFPGPRAISGAILAVATIVVLSQFIEQATGSHWNATFQDVGIEGAIQRPVALTVELVAAALLMVSALAFLRRGRRGEIRCGLLAARSVYARRRSAAVSRATRSGHGLDHPARRPADGSLCLAAGKRLLGVRAAATRSSACSAHVRA